MSMRFRFTEEEFYELYPMFNFCPHDGCIRPEDEDDNRCVECILENFKKLRIIRPKNVKMHLTERKGK